MDYRETNNVKRNDFMDLLIQLKNKGKLDDVDIDDKYKKDLVSEGKLIKIRFFFVTQ